MTNFQSIAACVLGGGCGSTTRNLHPVDCHVWRSAQPEAFGFEELKCGGKR